MAETFLNVSDLTKAFGPTVALRHVSFHIAAGETVGLVGENGAGKSTLMKILGGVIAPDSGAIAVNGGEYSALSVKQSMGAGIAFVHQELNLFENLTVAANIFIGREATYAGKFHLLDDRSIEQRAVPLLRQLGADIEPGTPVEALSLAQRQLVEIAKSLSLDAKLLILDEPTSSLTQRETEKLLGVVQKLGQQGVATIFISHRLGEVEQACQRVVVLRDGRTVATLKDKDIASETMVRHMIGRELKAVYRKPARPPGQTVLEVANIRTRAKPGSTASFAVHAGEILGLAGLVGSGRTELARVLAGIDKALAGDIRLETKALALSSPQDAIARGIYLVPEDRKGAGLILGFPIRQNVSMPDLPRYSPRHLVDEGLETEAAERQKTKLDLRCSSTAQPASDLSGGNQQKVALAKWLAMSPRVLIMDEPTRGIDVGAKDEIYRIMRELSDRGVAILMISSDMEEIIGVSDRVAVMHEGEIAGVLQRKELSEEAILSLAVGRARQKREAA